MKKSYCAAILVIALVLPQSVLAWNGTGHRLVASIAWDNLSDTARKNIVQLMLKAPKGNCLRELFKSSDGDREFFVEAATWPDILRGGKGVPAQCTNLHKPEWHFKDRFWSGFSGDSQNPPKDLNRPLAKVNAVERLEMFRPFVNGTGKVGDRAMDVAWILHLVGDIHQPLHTSGRVTATEQNGDGGGNTFFVGPTMIIKGKKVTPKLHGFWDNIVDNAEPRKPNEGNVSYIKRLTEKFESDFPKSHFTNLQPAQFDKWAIESLRKAQQNAYPKTLKRGVSPSSQYQTNTFRIAEESIAEAGYRLADLLEVIFGH
jgi:hypothetical protein